MERLQERRRLEREEAWRTEQVVGHAAAERGEDGSKLLMMMMFITPEHDTHTLSGACPRPQLQKEAKDTV